ncbi:Ltp family lipoprotein [Serinicoccus sp. LYQ131]|uniref:Ltp family lipoprotein n=1 Tax=Serinicoccus sp. LYQ131 TaxID=3378797 RepID=UPI00385478D1
MTKNPNPNSAPPPSGEPYLEFDGSTPAAPKKPWYKKKRFIIPGGLLALSIFAGITGDDDEGDVPAIAATQAEAEPAVEDDATESEVEPVVSEEDAAAEAAAAEEQAAADAEAAEEQAAADAAAEQEAAAAEEERAAEEAAAAAEAEEARAAEEAAQGTMSQQGAYRQAESYLEFSAFSRQGLIDQLSSEYGSQYPVEDAVFAIERLEAEGSVDWNDQALMQAESYLEFSAFSRQGLIDQLSSEHGSQYTVEQATGAVEALDAAGAVDWNVQAVRQAESYLEFSAFSRQALIDQLSSEYGSQFTVEQATHAVDTLGL